MDERQLDEWHFQFGLCAQDERLIPQSKCDELLDTIIDWAEANGYGVGGGFAPFDPEPDD
jgi:hypothetical protein